MSEYKNILAAIDVSKEADLVLEKANTFMKMFQSSLSIIHVIEPIILDNTYESLPMISPEIETSLIERAKSFQANTIDRLNINAKQTLTIVGSTKAEIINAAKEHNIDLIIIGTHGRHGLARLLGSTTNAVLHRAPCDVLCVKINHID